MRFSKRSAARSIISRRKFGFDLDQAGNAASAAETASRASFLEAEELDQSVSDEEGEMTGKVVVVMTSLPLIRRGTVKEDMMLGWIGREEELLRNATREVYILLSDSRSCIVG